MWGVIGCGGSGQREAESGSSDPRTKGPLKRWGQRYITRKRGVTPSPYRPCHIWHRGLGSLEPLEMHALQRIPNIRPRIDKRLRKGSGHEPRNCTSALPSWMNSAFEVGMWGRAMNDYFEILLCLWRAFEGTG